MKESIIFENSQLVVAYKAAGVLSVDSRLGKSEPRIVLARKLEDYLKVRLYPVHRLDFEVEGIILYAKNPKSHSLLSKAFEAKTITKTYFALSEKEAPDDIISKKQFWESVIVRGKKRSFEAPYGKKAETMALCLKNINYMNSKMSLWELKPLTGRSHQLRYEMSKHCFPILGDALYGSKLSLETHRIALQAYSLEISEEFICHQLEIPNKFSSQKTLMECLNIDS